jgi:sulfate/thiosulfate transport system permease protein
MTAARTTAPVTTGPDVATSGPARVSPPSARPPRVRRRPPVGVGLGLGTSVLYLSLIVLLPLAAVVWRGTRGGPEAFWRAVTTPDSWASLKLTVIASLLVAAINVVMGTVIAWVLVRDSFPGKSIVDTLIDLPFALPTIVAGLVLLALYGAGSPLHINLAYTQVSVVVALLFVTLPFVVRTVQPVLLELDRDMEQAAYSLGASPGVTFRRIILPNLLPAMLSGAGLAFTRSIAEFGSTVLLTGNLKFKTEVAAVNIFGRIESDDVTSAAAVSTALLVVSFVVLILLDLVQRWGARRD